MTADYVAFHAAERAESIAVVSDGRSTTYAELDRDLRKFAAGIYELGVRPGGAVAIECDDLRVTLLLMLACDRLGVATASIASREGPSALRLLARMDLLLSERAFPTGAARRHQAITPTWVQSILDRSTID